MEENQKNPIPDEALADVAGGAHPKRKRRTFKCQFCNRIFETQDERYHHVIKCPQNPNQK